ncbi:hypothetical protein M885DRAFT_414831, partial [Pelagophyceae sp. CCMP2097]
PITKEPLRDPVVTADGHSYERYAILEWWANTGRPTSPVTNEVLESTHLVPNIALRR